MHTGDKVYYLYTGKDGSRIKFAAIVLGLENDGVLIRVGRYDVHARDIRTFESTVPPDLLQPRSVPCSFEAELNGAV